MLTVRSLVAAATVAVCVLSASQAEAQWRRPWVVAYPVAPVTPVMAAPVVAGYRAPIRTFYAPSAYIAPAPVVPAQVVAPVAQAAYYAPAAPAVTSYYAPAAPAYAAPVTSYYAPSYSAPVTSYYAPTIGNVTAPVINAAPTRTYYAPSYIVP